jgi:hypothetical protein
MTRGRRFGERALLFLRQLGQRVDLVTLIETGIGDLIEHHHIGARHVALDSTGSARPS